MDIVFKDIKDPEFKKIESDWLEKFENQNNSLIGYIQENAISNIQKEQTEALEKLVKKRLEVIGHTFLSQEEFYSFCSKRIQKVSFTEEPFRHEIYLDFVDKNNRGTLLATYSTEINIERNGCLATITLG